MLLNGLKNEINYFKYLRRESQKLLFSYLFFSLASPILGIFVNAYVWRESGSLNLVALYNLCLAIGLTIGFYINGRLLNRVRISYLYLLGCILQGAIVFILVYFAFLKTESILLYGIISGIGSAFFWANKHFLVLTNTIHEQRFYFNSLEGSFGTATSITVPLVVGMFISLGSKANLYSIHAAYLFVSFIALLMLIVAGILIRDIKLHIDTIDNILMRNKSSKWNLFRLITFLMGLSDGIFLFVPTLLILIFLGKENILGTVQSLAALLSSLVIYYVGRKINIKNRSNVILLGIGILVVGSLIFGIYFGSISAIVYVVLSTLSSPLTWTPYQNLNFETIEIEEKIHHHHKYSYLFDQELFLNCGRIIGIIVLLALVFYANQTTALRFIPFIIAIAQAPLVILFRKVEKSNVK